MATYTESSNVTSMTIGKGAKKRDLIMVGIRHDFTSKSPTVEYFDYEYDSGASSDDPFGLRVESIRVLVAGDYNASATKEFGMNLGISKDAIVSSNQPADASNGGMFHNVSLADALSNGFADIAEKSVYDFNGRIITTPKVHIGYDLSAETVNLDVNIFVTFEKVKLTKNEYLEKLVRNI
jgi:hypothetical protein